MEVVLRADETKVRELCFMGFTEIQAREALVKCNNDTNQAASYLLDSPNQVAYVPPPGPPAQASSPSQRNPSPALQTADPTALADKDLQEVIARSLQDAKVHSAPDADTDIQRAIMESLNTHEDITDPNELRRDPSLPVGLMNVGNTCYFNSLLQFYFSIPDFRQAIFDFHVVDDQPEDRPPLPLHPAPNLLAAGNGAAGRPNPDEDQKGTAAPEDAEDVRRKQLIEFMRSLQEVFALMELSTKSYIDPSPVLKNLRDPDGNPVKVGDQEDVMQFNDIFLQYVDRGLQLSQSSAKSMATSDDDETPPSLVERLFYGTKEDTFRDTTTVYHTATDKFSQVVLQVSQELATINDSLEYDTTPNEVDGYMTEDGTRIRVRKYTWFKDLPPFLIFQLRRVDFDRRTQQLRKIMLPVKFPEVLYMDPYCARNAPVTIQRRQEVAKLKEKRHNIEIQYGAFSRFRKQPMGLDKILASAVTFLDEQEKEESAFLFDIPGEMPEDLTTNTLANVLDDYRKQVENKMTKMSQVIAQLNKSIKQTYNDMIEEEYNLHSVLVHGGSHATCGHYWAFIPCQSFGYDVDEATSSPMDTDMEGSPNSPPRNAVAPESLDWLQFNDKAVSKVPATKVWMEGEGGHSQSDASAYCLIYVREDANLPEKAKARPRVPQWLQEKVRAHNQALLTKCQQHNQAKLDNENFLELEKQFTHLQNLHPSEVSEQVPYQDPCVASFSAFLRRFGDLEVDDLKYFCLYEAYAWAFNGADLLADLHHTANTVANHRAQYIMQRLQAAPAQARNAVAMAKENYGRQYEIFSESALHYWHGLIQADENSWENAVRFLLMALYKDGEQTQVKARCYRRIHRGLAYVLKKYFDEVCLQIDEEGADLDRLLPILAWIAIQHRQHIGCEGGIWIYLACKWILKQEVLIALAQQAGRPEWATKIQDLTMLLTQPDGMDASSFSGSMPVNRLPEMPKCIGEELALGIYNCEKSLFPKYKNEEANVRYHTSNLVDMPAGASDSGI